MKKHLILVMLCLISGICIIKAQQTDKRITISGIVLDMNATPIENAVIFVDGKETNVKSDADGNFTIKVAKNAIRLGVVAIGTGVLEEEINGNSQIDFIFSREMADIQEFEEVVEKPGEEMVNTGYGEIKKKYVAGAIGFLDVEHSKRKFSTMLEILQSTPGLVFYNNNFYVAGTLNLNGMVPPLYVVDDIPASGSMPNASEVSSVTVLKGASAAIYGSRGFGGVVIITTRND